MERELIGAVSVLGLLLFIYLVKVIFNFVKKVKEIDLIVNDDMVGNYKLSARLYKAATYDYVYTINNMVCRTVSRVDDLEKKIEEKEEDNANGTNS